MKSPTRDTRLYARVRPLVVKLRERGTMTAWERDGRPAPPPHPVKQQTLLDYSRAYALGVLVETGTYYGDMVQALKSHFDTVYSIELSDELFEKAQRRFRRSPNVVLLHGDSAERLVEVVRELEGPTLFWLDGHYSGGETARGKHETPVLAELEQILASRSTGHVIVIDDARLFGADPAYPTIDELRAFIDARRHGLDICVELDSIRITPKAP